ncbi:MAG TPA: hypothetical protein VFT04_07285 [Gemmatimonadales bacterium]|nr:hypothetical protein [Gemmatimonadales bacterium]
MQLIRRCFGILLFVIPLLFGCSTLSDAARRQAVADSLRADSVRLDSIRTDSIRADSIARADSIRADSVRTDSIARADSIRAARASHSARPPVRRFAATDTVPWPDIPDPAPGALLPTHRIIAFYGNPLSRRMGILGELPPAEMLAKLEQTAAEWAEADSTKDVIPALHMIVTVAQAAPGGDGKYRLRMTDSLMHRVARWAEERGWLFFVDVQVGLSDVRSELPRLLPLLRRPYVHLALDPEFDMYDGIRPGRRIGTMDAADVNYAIGMLADIVRTEGVPPKILVIHRFTEKMLTNAGSIRKDPTVQVVIDMDGFGSPQLKRSTWRAVVQRDPVQYTGFKLFYKNDKPMMTPKQVIELFPSPVYIQYQ